MTSGIPPSKKEIKEFPENYNEMIKKLQERENEKTQGSIQKIEEAKEKLKRSEERRSSEHKKLSDKEKIVQIEPKSPEIHETKKQIGETSAVAQKAIKDLAREYPSLEDKVPGLKGRISQADKHER